MKNRSEDFLWHFLRARHCSEYFTSQIVLILTSLRSLYDYYLCADGEMEVREVRYLSKGHADGITDEVGN